MIKPVFKTPDSGHYFFGYYDKVELDADNTKLLALKVSFLDHVPESTDVAEVGYFDINSSEQVFHKIGETKSFNWQQGCMLQWLGADYKSKILYNDLRDGSFVTVIYDINTQTEKVLPRAVYNVTPDGKNGLCVDFERHYWCRRGYSYDGVIKEEKNVPVVPGDGIWLLNLETGEDKQILSLETLMNFKPLSNMTGGTHYVEHIMCAPDSKRMAFLHRWKIADGGIYARLYTANIDGTELHLLNDSGRVGHFNWKSAGEVIAYCGLENKINKIRKYKALVKYFLKPILPLYHKMVKDNSKISKMITGDSYVIFKDKTHERKRIALDISDEDGHPSIRPYNQNQFITDTYPDPKDSPQGELILFNIAEDKAEIIDMLDSIAEYDNSPLRCDLHPRWSVDGDYVSVDTMDRGVRGIYLYRLEK